ncbi:hypothetical protein D7J03_22765 [Salmonella enterica]|nr:hypothetical protein [Salmonella enterica]EBL9827252.1 hypothetical protein [Salmonella enterica]
MQLYSVLTRPDLILVLRNCQKLCLLHLVDGSQEEHHPSHQKKADENRWKYYLEKIHEWIAVLEAHEKLLGPAEKIKRFWEKSKLGSICMVFIALIAFANDIFDFFCNIQTYL